LWDYTPTLQDCGKATCQTTGQLDGDFGSDEKLGEFMEGGNATSFAKLKKKNVITHIKHCPSKPSFSSLHLMA